MCGIYTAYIGILEQNHRVFDGDLKNCNIVALFFLADVENVQASRKRVVSVPKASVMTKYLLEYFNRKGYLDLENSIVC